MAATAAAAVVVHLFLRLCWLPVECCRSRRSAVRGCSHGGSGCSGQQGCAGAPWDRFHSSSEAMDMPANSVQHFRIIKTGAAGNCSGWVLGAGYICTCSCAVATSTHASIRQLCSPCRGYQLHLHHAHTFLQHIPVPAPALPVTACPCLVMHACPLCPRCYIRNWLLTGELVETASHSCAWLTFYCL
jgi:hypothetical protein